MVSLCQCYRHIHNLWAFWSPCPTLHSTCYFLNVTVSTFLILIVFYFHLDVFPQCLYLLPHPIGVTSVIYVFILEYYMRATLLCKLTCWPVSVRHFKCTVSEASPSVSSLPPVHVAVFWLIHYCKFCSRGFTIQNYSICYPFTPQVQMVIKYCQFYVVKTLILHVLFISICYFTSL